MTAITETVLICEECEGLRRRLASKQGLLSDMMVEQERVKEREQRACGEADGLRKALKEAHERLRTERDTSTQKLREMQTALTRQKTDPKFTQLLSSLESQLAEKNAAMQKLLADNPAARDRSDLLATQELLSIKQETLRQTQLELLKQKRRADHLAKRLQQFEIESAASSDIDRRESLSPIPEASGG